MRIGVLGAGYVGLVTGTCLAEMGNDVIVADVDPRKIESLKTGKSPHYEPGLDDLLSRNIEENRLTFSTEPAEAIKDSTAIFLAVGTPMGEDGSANLSYIESAITTVGEVMDGHRTVIIKSTVPVGTNRRLTKALDAATNHTFDVVSNPEFLKEGAAVDDFMRPDRVVVGVRSEEAARLMRQIYDPFVRTGRPIMLVDPESAEMIKYTSNALLASRISFMNEMAQICSRMGADIDLVRRGVGADSRIGQAFLFPGLGYGGSCFPKDVRALEYVAHELDLDAPMCSAIDQVNQRQRNALLPDIEAELGTDLAGITIAVWGLAFKPRTDDVREAPALHLCKVLHERGATIVVYDPEAMETAKVELGDLVTYGDSRYSVLEGADALLICTEWNEFRSPDFHGMAKMLKNKLIFDGRNLYDLAVLKDEGYRYYSIGRPPVLPHPKP